MANKNFFDYSDNVLDALDNAVKSGLLAAALVVEAEAKSNAPVDQGGLRASITHKIDAGAQRAEVGSTSEYAEFVEYGTGEHAENGAGRKGFWVYVDGSDAHGTGGKTYTLEEAKKVKAIILSKNKGLTPDMVHITNGTKATKFMRNAFKAKTQDVENVIGKSLGAEL